MNLKASVASQRAFGNPLLAPLVSTHASATQVSPPCEWRGVSGVVLAQPSTWLLKRVLTGLASPSSSHLRENVRGVRSVRRHPPGTPPYKWRFRARRLSKYLWHRRLAPLPVPAIASTQLSIAVVFRGTPTKKPPLVSPARGRGRKGRGRTHHENAAYSRLPPETMFAESPPHVPMGAIRAKTHHGRERSDPRSGHGSASGMTGMDAGRAGCPCPTLAPVGGMRENLK
jgi:hypothetical protein